MKATDGGEVYFSAMRQKSTKENAPKRGRTYGFAPLGDPPTPVGMLHGDVLTLAEVSIRRKDAFREVNCVRVHTRHEAHRNSHWAG